MFLATALLKVAEVVSTLGSSACVLILFDEPEMPRHMIEK